MKFLGSLFYLLVMIKEADVWIWIRRDVTSLKNFIENKRKGWG